MIKTVISLSLSFFLIACSVIPYQKKEIEISKINESINTEDINNEEFYKYLINHGYQDKSLPLKSWGLNEITLAQQYFNYEIKTEKKLIEAIKVNENIALQNPSTSIGVSVGRSDSNQELSKNIFGVNLRFLFERANKKLIRYEIAFNETQHAILKHELRLWELRTDLLKKIVSFIELQDLINITRDELKLKHSILNMIKKRVEFGVLSQVDYNKAFLDLKFINQELLMMQHKHTRIKKDLATSIGLSIEKFNLIPIDTKGIKIYLNQTGNKFIHENNITDIKYRATMNSKKLRLLLASYAIAESKLKYEIANQYPDFNFSPAYTYDLGSYIWDLGIDVILESNKKYEMFIDKARKIRASEARKVMQYQLEIINESEILLSDFNYSMDLVKYNETLRKTKDQLKKQLMTRFDNGILDRLELELELIKLNEIERNYHTAFYNVIKKGLDAESIVQEPIFTDNYKQ